MKMFETSNKPLRVELLKANHFSMLTSSQPAKRLNWLQLMLVNNWIAQAEKRLPNWLPPKRPFCLVALENQDPIALVIIRPCNIRGTSWSISFPEPLSSPKEYSLKTIRQKLLQYSMQLENNKAKSWIIRCPANDQNQLSIARELGFQPLKILNNWTPPIASRESSKPNPNLIGNYFEWQDVNKTNAQHLRRLEQAGESSHLRQILDRQSRDLIEPNQPFNGVLISTSSKPYKAIAGLISREFYEDQLIIELVRDVAWDERISTMLPNILNKINSSMKKIILETSNEDAQLSSLLKEVGWTLKSETVLLGKSLWRRRENPRLIKGTRQIESMLGRLGPQRPPLPTPTLGPR